MPLFKVNLEKSTGDVESIEIPAPARKDAAERAKIGRPHASVRGIEKKMAADGRWKVVEGTSADGHRGEGEVADAMNATSDSSSRSTPHSNSVVSTRTDHSGAQGYGVSGALALLGGTFSPVVATENGARTFSVAHSEVDAVLFVIVGGTALVLAGVEKFRALLIVGLVAAFLVGVEAAGLYTGLGEIYAGNEARYGRDTASAVQETISVQWGWIPLVGGVALLVLAGASGARSGPSIADTAPQNRSTEHATREPANDSGLPGTDSGQTSRIDDSSDVSNTGSSSDLEQDFDLYDVIVPGGIVDGHSHEQVVKRLTERFSIDPQKAEQLLARGDTIVKKRVSEEQAMKIQRAFTKMGVICTVKLDLDLDI